MGSHTASAYQTTRQRVGVPFLQPYVHLMLSPSSRAKMSYSEKPSKAIDLSHHLSNVSRARGLSPLKGLARYLERPGLISLAGGEHRPCVSDGGSRRDAYALYGRRSIHSCMLQECPARPTFLLLPFPVMVSVTDSRRLSFQSSDHFHSSCCSTALVPESFSTSASNSEGSVSWLWKLFGGSSRKEKTAPITVPKYPANSGDINLAQALQYGTATGLPQLREFINNFAEKVYQPAYSDWTTLVHTGNTDGSVFKIY